MKVKNKMLHPALPSNSRRKNSKRKRTRSQNMLGFERLESKNLLASLTVSTANEFVDAIATANADTSIRKIEFAESADVVEIDTQAIAEKSAVGDRALWIECEDRATPDARVLLGACEVLTCELGNERALASAG